MTLELISHEVCACSARLYSLIRHLLVVDPVDHADHTIRTSEWSIVRLDTNFPGMGVELLPRIASLD